MRTYRFFQDKRWYEDLGHILIGLVPFWGWWREHRQWPPGDIIIIARSVYGRHPNGPVDVRTCPEDRVADAYRDFLGYAIGDLLRTAALVGLLVWRC